MRARAACARARRRWSSSGLLTRAGGPRVARRMHGDGKYTDADGKEWVGRFYNGEGPGLTEFLK